MLTKQALLKEIETLPQAFVDEVFHYVSFLKQYKPNVKIDDITLVSE